MLELRPGCECCDVDLPPAAEATICSFECTYCPACAAKLGGICPNCGGELVRRPVRPAAKLAIRRFGCLVHPMEKRERCGADAEGELDRSDWGMSLYTDDGAGTLKLRIQVEALRDEPPASAQPD